MGNILTKDQYGATKSFDIDKEHLQAYYSGWRFFTQLDVYYRLDNDINIELDVTFFEGGTYLDTCIFLYIFGFGFSFEFDVNRRGYERRYGQN
jgi:hypothetical protein